MAEGPNRRPVESDVSPADRRLELPQARLLETARLLANEGGHEAVTIDAVCRRAG